MVARFTEDTAAKTGKSERTIQRDAQRGEDIDPPALGMVRGTPLDTGAFLDQLRKIKPENQLSFVERKLEALRASMGRGDATAKSAVAFAKDTAAKTRGPCAKIWAGPHMRGRSAERLRRPQPGRLAQTRAIIPSPLSAKSKRVHSCSPWFEIICSRFSPQPLTPKLRALL